MLETVMELGRETPLLADYMFTLLGKTDGLSQYKLARVLLNVDNARRTSVGIGSDLHQKIKKLAILNDLKICVLANATIEDVLSDQEKIATLNRRLKL